MLISKFFNIDVEDSLNIFEERIGVSLPNDYRKFLLSYNGGITAETMFRINKITSDIVAFYGFGNVDREYSFLQFDEMNVLNNYLERGIIPIGYNVFGDKIAIGIADDNYNKVYFVYHDGFKMTELTTSFIAFIGKCKSKKIGNIPSIEERKKRMIENGLGDKISEEAIRGWQAEIDEYKNIHQEKVVL